jgi:hypothetical protein
MHELRLNELEKFKKQKIEDDKVKKNYEAK